MLGFVAVLGCGQIRDRLADIGSAADNSPKAADKGSRDFSLEGKEWKTFELDAMDIKVDLPGGPVDKTPSAAQMPRGINQVFSAMKIKAYDQKVSNLTELNLLDLVYVVDVGRV